ncbi:MAG: hypothetical protein C0505_09115 [Leptothrix sp. (in: Bacteria)]|nr:hypothetical protein [Leptothrix sp. (in: b-proteobacteria)]
MRLAALLLITLAGIARAQAPDVQLAPSRLVECLTPPAALRGQPEYPTALDKRGEGGRVLVEMVFTGVDRRPEVNVLENQGDESLAQAVKAHVTAFRMPCAEAADLPVRLRQNYIFKPGSPVLWTTPTDEAAASRARVLKCMAANDGSKHPDYPAWARRVGAQGRVLAKLRFSGPDLPPEVALHASSRAVQRLAEDAVQPWAAKLRLPCIEGAAIETFVQFVFRVEDAPAFGFRDATFFSFLRRAKNLDRPGAVFDTATMACPFDLTLIYRQPYYPNQVGERDAAQASRRPLLEWLSTLVLDLGQAQQDSVAGDTVTFTVPCLKIDFNPKEKTS